MAILGGNIGIPKSISMLIPILHPYLIFHFHSFPIFHFYVDTIDSNIGFQIFHPYLTHLQQSGHKRFTSAAARRLLALGA